MPTGTLSTKGRITIPKQVRDQLHLKAGSRIDFITNASGQVALKPMLSFESLRGIVKSRRKRPVSIEEMNEAIARGYSGT